MEVNFANVKMKDVVLMSSNKIDKDNIEFIGDNHITTNLTTPSRGYVFEKPNNEEIADIKEYFQKIMEELGIDITNDSLSGTPYRVAKMYIKELFYGLNPDNKPRFSTFYNKYSCKKMLIEKNIILDSSCEHHFMPIAGFTYVYHIYENQVIMFEN